MLCLTTHYPPFSIYRPESNDFVGLDMMYMKHLATQLNWNLQVINFPWGRVKMEIEKDNFDCFFALSYDENRSAFLDYTHYPLHVTRFGVFFNRQRADIRSRQLAGKVIGVLRGIPLAAEILQQYGLAGATIQYLDSNETLLAILKTGRVDASVVNYAVGTYLLDELALNDQLDSYEIEGYRLPVFLALRKGKYDIGQIDTVLSQMLSAEAKRALLSE